MDFKWFDCSPDHHGSERNVGARKARRTKKRKAVALTAVRLHSDPYDTSTTTTKAISITTDIGVLSRRLMVQYAGTMDGRGERVNWNITSVRFSKP